MTSATCNSCGLPSELCVCSDMAKTESTVTVTKESRSFNKSVTLVKGLESDVDKSELASNLKSNLACGGTVKNGNIELQGEHISRVASLLEEDGLTVNVNDT